MLSGISTPLFCAAGRVKAQPRDNLGGKSCPVEDCSHKQGEEATLFSWQSKKRRSERAADRRANWTRQRGKLIGYFCRQKLAAISFASARLRT
jgi:hypothetical protein